MSFYENNKDWLEGWEHKFIWGTVSDKYIKEGMILTVRPRGFSHIIVKDLKLLVTVDERLAIHKWNNVFIPHHFTNWKQPTDNEQEMFEMLYGVRLPWKEFIV